MRFGEYMLMYRKEKKLSTVELAKKCGISRSYITLMENGKRLPGKKVIPKIANALDLKTNVVINWYLEDVRKRLEEG